MEETVKKLYIAGNLRGPQGPQGIPGKDGQNGVDGKTPEKGVDYFTESDKAELLDAILDEIPEAGSAPANIFQVTYAGVAYDPSTFETDIILTPGDILIATNESNIKTGYTYDSENGWLALDGNVYADNVLLKEDITLAGNYTQVGNITKSQNGTGTFSTAGKSVTAAFTEIFSKRLQPSITANPAVSITLTGAGSYEVGTTVIPKYSASLSAGSYTYGPATGITAQSWSVKDTKSNTSTTASGSFPEITVADGVTYNVTATATYNQGVIAKDNLGSDSNPVVQIAASSKSKTSSSITGYRKMFWGSKTAVQTADSATIRALSSKATATGTLSVSVVEGAKYVVIAVPAARKITKVEDTGAFGTDIFGSFTLTENVMVEGNNGYTSAAYKVYEYKPSTALGSNTYKVTIT